ncbi:unnamed protein product [Lactuca virosa]|uniref:Knottin scorpion toxin-like domain-containing protein n=1 Tax=Lactuca virosa TaxID=75947 RepID=A0AAU9LQ14_9ASTR|nr:unnamed protein product [Lactuca virosa]
MVKKHKRIKARNLTMKNISIFVAIVLISILTTGCKVLMACNERDLTLITGFCKDSTCENTCVSNFGLGASGNCKSFWKCHCKWNCVI